MDAVLVHPSKAKEVETFKKPEPSEEEKEALAKKETEKAARIKAAKEAKAAKAAGANGSDD